MMETIPKQGKLRKRQIIEFIKKEGEAIGYYNLNIHELSRTLHISRDTVYRYLNRLYAEGISPDAVGRASMDINAMHRSIFQGLHEDFNSGDHNTRYRIASTMIENSRAYVEFLEKIGLKSPNIVSGSGESRFANWENSMLKKWLDDEAEKKRLIEVKEAEVLP